MVMNLLIDQYDGIPKNSRKQPASLSSPNISPAGCKYKAFSVAAFADLIRCFAHTAIFQTITYCPANGMFLALHQTAKFTLATQIITERRSFHGVISTPAD
jgi:hypothetical protein